MHGDPSGAPVLYRLGRATASHPLATIAAWAVLLVLAVFSSGTFADRMSTQNNQVDNSDSARAATLVARAFPDAPTETDFVVLHSAALTAQDPAFRSVVEAAVNRFPKATRSVRAVTDPYTSASTLISPDGHTALVAVSMDGEPKDLQRDAELLGELAAGLRTDQVAVSFTGQSPLAAAAIDQAGVDLGRAEMIGFPIAALVLLVAFGSLVAAAIPLALGFTAILGSFGALGVFAYIMEFSTITRSSVTMLAIALGIDYSLFIVTRYREELASTGATSRAERAEAIAVSMATAGRAVLFSGTTVMISLAGLFLVRSPAPRSMAVGMMVSVLVMLLLACTLLPAVLGLLGRGINALALPWARRSIEHPDPEHSGWARMTALVMRRPAAVAVVVSALLGLLALPTFGLRYGVDTGAGAVTDTPAGRGFTAVSSAFAPGLIAPVTVVASSRKPLGDAELTALADLSGRLGADDRVAAVVSLTTALDQRAGGHTSAHLAQAQAAAPGALSTMLDRLGHTTLVTVYPRYAADSARTQALVKRVRSEVARVLVPVGVRAHVGGDPAKIVDISAENSRSTPLVIGAVLAASWLLLLLVFRSLVLPFQAIVMNLLSVGAAFGAVVLVFQEGHGADLLGIDRTGFIQVLLPLLTFAVAFGLSMDYEVFLLSRMREEWDRTGDNTTAVRLGITHTAKVITSAALIMVSVFAAFMLATMLETKQLGFMLAVAVLIDATVVRMLLVPAVMRLLGRWNWWMPGQSRARASRPTPP